MGDMMEEIQVFDSDTNELVLQTVINTTEINDAGQSSSSEMESSSDPDDDDVVIDVIDDTSDDQSPNEKLIVKMPKLDTKRVDNPNTDNDSDTNEQNVANKLDKIHPAFGWYHAIVNRKPEETGGPLYRTLTNNMLGEKVFYKRANNNRKHKCSHCSKLFKYKYKLEEHEKRDHSTIIDNKVEKVETDVNETCQDTAKESDTESVKNVNDESKPTDAARCGSPEAPPTASKDGKSPHLCSLCNTSFRYLSRLHRHMKNVHMGRAKEVENVFKCNDCDLMWLSRTSLNRHNRTHHNKVTPDATPNHEGVRKVERPLTELGDVNKPYPMNFNPMDFMNFRRFKNVMKSQQAMIPAIPPHFAYPMFANFRPALSSVSNCVTNVQKTTEQYTRVSKVEKSSPPKVQDDNVMPLDLSLKTGSPSLPITGCKDSYVNGVFKNIFSGNGVPINLMKEERCYQRFLPKDKYFKNC